MMKKIIVLAIIFILSFSAFTPLGVKSFGAQNSELLIFGGAVSGGAGVETENSYAKLFSVKNRLNLKNYAVHGLTTEELNVVLDGISDSEIRNAGLIVVETGLHDILNVLDTVLLKIDAAELDAAAINRLGAELESESFVSKMQKAVDDFEIEFNKVADRLRAKNTEVAVFTVYNPYSGIMIENQLAGIERFNLGLYVEFWLDKMNACIRGRGDIKIVDIFEVFEVSAKKLVNATITLIPPRYVIDPYPTKAGQMQIYESLNTFYTQSNKPTNSGKLPAWAVALIVVGCTILLAAAAGAGYFAYKKKKTQKI
ncbi:MAG: hypothetical protein LBQ27_03835 [Clostridiales bacterium]|jgi:hypothetical protein|nr:hypothetical protein [Clostridiales bacterium]